MSRIIAIATSDWHLHKFRDFDQNGSRLNWSLEAARYISGVAIKHKVPILFAGDLLHNPKEVENETLTKIATFFRDSIRQFICIAGNHDMSQKNGLDNRSPHYFDTLATAFPDRVFVADEKGWPNTDMNVYGFNYYNDEEELVKQIKKLRPAKNGKLNILLLHGNPAGCIQPNGTESESDFPRDMDSFFKRFDLVLWGHIHKPQQIGKKSYMLGSPIHQNFGDEGIDMGYWEVYSDGKMNFISLNSQFPCFIRSTLSRLQKLTKKKQLKDLDYIRIIDDPKQEKEVEGDFNIFKKTRKELSKTYCKKKGIKDKQKIKALTSILNRV